MQSGTLPHRATWTGVAFAIALGIDFVTKWLIVNFVMVPPRTIEIAPFFNLSLGFNTGVAFGMFRELFFERPLLLAGISAVIVTGVMVWAIRAEKRLETISAGLIAGGAAGNVVDRLRQGAVTDFLDFHVGDWHWPAFNMADVLIVTGATLLMTASLWRTRSIKEGLDRAGTR